MKQGITIRRFQPRDAAGVSRVIIRAEEITSKPFYSAANIRWWCNQHLPEHILEKARD